MGMESITGRRPLLAALARGLGPADRAGLALGFAVLAALAAIDAWVGRTEAIVGGFVLAPFIPAILGSVLATVLVALATVAVAFASGSWDANFGETGYWIRNAEVVLGSVFAIVAAGARERARVSSGRLAVLDAVGAIADGSLPLAETLDRVTETIVPIAADMCMIDAIHEGRVIRAAVRVGGRPDAAEIEERVRRRRPSIPTRFITAERAWIRIAHYRRRIDDEELRRMAHGPSDLDFLRSLRPRSLITAAMTARGRSLGTLTLVTAWSKRRFTADDVRFAQVLANRIGMALDNAGLFSDLESVERRLDAVMSMLDEAVAVQDATGDLVYANHTAARWLGFSTPREMLDSPRGELARRFEAWTEHGVRVSADSIAARPAEGRLPRRELLRLRLTASGDERWVVVSSEPILGPEHRLLYAVTTVEDVTELKRSEFAQQLLARTGELLASSIDYRETLEAVARVAVPEFADWCSVNVPDPDGFVEQVAIAHADPERVEVANRLRERYPVHLEGSDPLAEVIRADKPLLVHEISEEALAGAARDREHLRLMRSMGTGSAITVPMTAASGVVGALAFVNQRGSRRFEQADLTIALEIARRAGLAIENARLAGEQAEVARVLQRGLRPPEIPAMRGFEVATMYRPAGEINEVGGDFYDAFEIGGGWMVAIGDVTGRGAAAASLTALARYTIRTAGKLTGSPFLAASLVDESLKRAPELSLCSAVILVLPNSEDDRAPISILVAGHPLPLLVRRGEAQTVGRPGPLLGAPHEPDWEVTRVELSPGDQLVLYTDGVTEARGRDDRFGEERLRASLAAVGSPGTAVAAVESALDSFVTGVPEDDAAILAVMRSSSPPGLDVSAGSVRQEPAGVSGG
jgi:PAS domain S-box-containing protein